MESIYCLLVMLKMESFLRTFGLEILQCSCGIKSDEHDKAVSLDSFQHIHDQNYGTSNRRDWINVFGIPICPSFKGICSSPLYRYPFRTCHKISCMAGTPHNGDVYYPWTSLCHCLGNGRPPCTKSESSLMDFFSEDSLYSLNLNLQDKQKCYFWTPFVFYSFIVYLV